MNKQESYKTYMILIISSDGNQNNVSFISARYRSPFFQVFWFAAIGLPNKDPWKFHIMFSWSRLEIPLRFYLNPRNSTCYFFDTPGPGNFLSSALCLDFS